MASQVRKTFYPESVTDALQLENQECIVNQQSTAQFVEDIYTSPCAQLSFPSNENGSLAKQELQTLWEMFTSWLQPEKHSKEQIISQLVLEQFFLTGYCKDKFALKEKWESSERNMERFMEGLTDECLKPPVMVCVSRLGQKALFSENMPLKEVIKYLKHQQSTPRTTHENLNTHLQRTQDTFVITENENSEDGCKTHWNASERNDANSHEHEMVPLLIVQADQYAQPEDGCVSYETTQNARKTKECTSKYQVVSQRTCSSQTDSMKVKPEKSSRAPSSEDAAVEVLDLSRPDLPLSVPLQCLQKNNVKPTYEVCQERIQTNLNTNRCDECPQTITEPSNHLTNKKKPRKKRSFFCTICHKGFYTRSDLRVHKIIHEKNKPFKCHTCKRSFSHKTNLMSHERIHTGEKPFVCLLCNRTFRQSSTCHRHLRNRHKSDLLGSMSCRQYIQLRTSSAHDITSNS